MRSLGNLLANVAVWINSSLTPAIADLGKEILMLIDAAKSVVKQAAGAGLGMLIHAVTERAILERA